MNGYTKLFSDIVDSSIWDEDSDTCKVWVTILALSDWDGFVRGSVGWLAGKSRVSLEACESALAKFASPDPRSRTPDNDGRRIERLEDGWLVLNYISFRDRLSADPKAVATRERVQRHRERYKALRNAESVTQAHSVHVSESSSEGKRVQGETPTIETVLLSCAKSGILASDGEWFWHKMEGQGWKVAGEYVVKWASKLKSWQAQGILPSQNPKVDRNGKPILTGEDASMKLFKSVLGGL